MVKIILFCRGSWQTNVSFLPKNNCCAKRSESATPPWTASSADYSLLPDSFFLCMEVSLQVCMLCLLRKGAHNQAHNHDTRAQSRHMHHSRRGIVRRWHANREVTVHNFVNRSDPYPSQQARNQTRTCNPYLKFGPCPAHKLAAYAFS